MFGKDKEIQKFIKEQFKNGKTKEDIEKELKKKGQSFYINNLSAYPDTILFQKYKRLHYILIGLLGFSILLRLMSIPFDSNLAVTLIFLSLAVGIPILLILYLRTHRKDAYLIVSALVLMGLSRRMLKMKEKVYKINLEYPKSCEWQMK